MLVYCFYCKIKRSQNKLALILSIYFTKDVVYIYLYSLQ